MNVSNQLHRAILLFFLLLPARTFGAAPSGGGDMTFDSPTAGAVFFSHELHTATKGIRCMACHFRMFEETGGSYRMKKEKITKRDFCEYCHNGMKGFDAQDVKNCSRCHKKK